MRSYLNVIIYKQLPLDICFAAPWRRGQCFQRTHNHIAPFRILIIQSKKYKMTHTVIPNMRK